MKISAPSGWVSGLRLHTDQNQAHLVQVLCWQCFVQTTTVFRAWRCVGADRRQQQQQHRSLHDTHPALRQKSNTARSVYQDSSVRGDKHVGL